MTARVGHRPGTDDTDGPLPYRADERARTWPSHRSYREVTVTLQGGQLLIAWGEDGRVTMTGPATESFRGTFDWGDFA